MERSGPESDEPALLERVRLGEDAAFGELFELHAGAVRRLARGLANDASEAEDITAETFFRVLQAVRRGNGPKDNVRAYLLTVARRVSWEWHGARRDVPVTDDELTNRVGAGADSQNRTAEATLITRAFSSLPERWRTVLWQTEVEGVQPASAAQHFGLTPNATAALARRARLGLRAAYLQAHLAAGRSSDGCRTVVEKLGGYTAGSVTGSEARKVKAHLATCASCSATHDELRQVCSSLQAHAGVVVLLVPAAGLGATSGFGAAGGAAGGVSAASGGSAVSGAGTFAALGTHVKIGLAVASTATIGAVGVAAVPGGLGDQAATVGLPGRGEQAELRIADPTSSPASRHSPPEQAGPVPERETGTSTPDHDTGRPGPLGVTEYSLPVQPQREQPQAPEQPPPEPGAEAPRDHPPRADEPGRPRFDPPPGEAIRPLHSYTAGSGRSDQPGRAKPGHARPTGGAKEPPGGAKEPPGPPKDRCGPPPWAKAKGYPGHACGDPDHGKGWRHKPFGHFHHD